MNLGRLKRGPLCGPTDCRIESEEDLGEIGNSSGTVPARLSILEGVVGWAWKYLRLQVSMREPNVVCALLCDHMRKKSSLFLFDFQILILENNPLGFGDLA